MKTGLFGLSILLGLPILSASMPNAWAGDFNNAQRTFVPTSRIQRRYDTEPVGQTNWGTDSGGNSASPNGASSGNSAPLSADGAMNALSGARNPASLSIAFTKGKVTLGRLIEKGKWDDAEKLALKLIRVNPRDQELRDKLTQILVAEARIAYAKADLEMAASKSREALVTEPTNQPAKLLLSQVFAKKGLNFQSAKDHLKLADGFAAQSKFVDASAEYHLALGIKPSASGHIGLGNVLVGEGHAEEGAKEYQIASQIDPKSSIAYRQLGSLRLAVHDLIGANRDLSQAVTLNPNDTQAATELIELWQHQVSSDLNGVNGHLGLARAYLITGSLEAAQTEYREVARLDPNNAGLPTARAAFKVALARREAKKCVDMAKTLNGQGAYQDAHEQLVEALKYSKPTPDVLLLYGQVSEKLGLFDDAHEAYMTVLKEDPANVAAAQHLKTLPHKPQVASPDKGNTFPPVAPNRSNADSQPVSTPTVQADPASNTNQASVQPTPAASTASNLKPPTQAEDPLAAVNSDVPSSAVTPTPPRSPASTPPTNQTTSTPPSPPANQTTTAPPSPPTAGTPSSSSLIQVAPGAGLPAPDGLETVAHTSKLGTFFNSIKGLSANPQQQQQAAGYLPGAVPYYMSGGAYGGANAQALVPGQYPAQYPGQYPVATGGYMMPAAYPGSPYPIASQVPVGYTNGAMVNAYNPANSQTSSPSLLGLLAKPLTNKLGMQPLGSNNSQAQNGMVNVGMGQQLVQASNGAYYMVPTGVPMNVAYINAPTDQGNPALNDLAGSSLGKKFHLAQVVQDGSGVGSFLGNVKLPKLPAKQQSRTQVSGVMAPTTPQYQQFAQSASGDASGQAVNVQVGESPPTSLVQIKNWNTGNDEAETASAPANSGMDDENSDSTADGAKNPTSGSTEIALKPAIGALPMGASWAHAITLQISEVKPTLSGSKVKVVLKNNSTKTLNISEHQKVAFQTEEKPEQLLDIQFDLHHVTAGGSALGTIKLPVHQLDPDADLYLPKFLEDGKKLADLHATTDF